MIQQEILDADEAASSDNSFRPSRATGVTVDVRNVTKSFGSRTAVYRVQFEAEPSEFVAVIGHSGCGKSTLLRLIAGLEQATTGSVLVDGQEVAGISLQTRMMFQEPRLLPWKTVEQNVSLGIRGDARRIVLDVLSQVGLADRHADLPHVLSGGQKQRVALARALASKPRLLLLDEPLGALDALTRIEMQQLIERIWQEEGFTAVLVTHDVEEAVILADTVVLINEGTIEDVFLVDLPRPRRRSHPRVGELSQILLDRLLRRSNAPPSDGPAHDVQENHRTGSE
jgi:sulfonate transport system ATP-binding protein